VTDRPVAVEAANVSKKFRLLKERNNSLKATVMRRRRIVADDFWALRDVSFEVYEGETFGLIGENGSGKSTMLKCLTKILRPNEGTVSVNGKVSALLELGAGFHQELSGRENVFLNGAILGLSQKELRKRFDEIVDFAGIGDFIDEPVKNYSSGMYVRLAFSVAINVDPDVLMVDEVLAVGDENFSRKCFEKFADMRDQGKTIVLVTHSLSAVQNMCDRVAWFSHGKLMEVGEPRPVIESYTETVHVDRRVDNKGRYRWGSAEGLIEAAEWLDEAGQPCTYLRTGRPARLRLTYDFREPIERPVFWAGIRTVDGFVVSNPSTKDLDCVPDKLEGSGYVYLDLDRLVVLPGTYDLSVSLTDYAALHIYDARQNILRFDVDRGDFHEQSGVAALDGAWKIEPL
jgi:ABC-type polysaccharide/polyol phosphate transport system ATPase subunit